MKVLIVQHVECEGPGYLEDFLHEKRIEYEIARMYEREQLPDDFDVLVVLGGPMNVYEEVRHPYLKGLNKTIKNFSTEGGYYLGFCLGGQLLAKTLGAKVRKNHTREIGIFKIHLTEEGVEDPLFKGFKHTFPALEWHGDTFEIPKEALKLAESELCSNQAFRFKNAYGLQFHLETTPGMLKEWVNVYEEELNEEGIDAAIMLKEIEQKADIYRELSNQLFTNFLELVK
ncbi:MAG: type 1 glutamine amidotransferase [Methanophagales archaeon]|nr:type 1 glutamine amidotransferase [Methanophagales archaeon]MCW3142042.1 type 1 glutamine amidotransferase [Methanophagales archaeon]